MVKISAIDSVIKELIKKTDEDDGNWISEKKRLQSMIVNGSLSDRQWTLKLSVEH